MSNLISGKKLIWLEASNLPHIGITDFVHIKVSAPYTGNLQLMYILGHHTSSEGIIEN